MKTLLAITALFLTLFAQAQDTDSLHEKAYNTIMAHTPKALVADTLTQPQTLKGIPFNIGNLHIIYGNPKSFKLTESDIKWLENEVNQLAVAFYLEGTPVILHSGCLDDDYTKTLFYAETRNGREVTILNLCYNFISEMGRHSKFISIFNKRTEALLAAAK